MNPTRQPVTPQPTRCPETEAAQEVHGPCNQQEHRDRQSAQLYRHSCALESERDRLLAALKAIVQFDALTYDMEARGMKDIARAAIVKASA